MPSTLWRPSVIGPPQQMACFSECFIVGEEGHLKSNSEVKSDSYYFSINFNEYIF